MSLARGGGGILQRVSDFIREHQLFRPGDRLIVGLSGGADSVALLHLLLNLTPFRPELVIAHINHCLRGAESDQDELFVRQLAQHYGIPCFVKRADVAELAEKGGVTLEEAGRDVRYSFFEKLRLQYNAVAVAVAHHADDQAETLLIRLLRGGGIRGLSAMLPRNSFHVVRPLLQITRREIEQYLAENRLEYRNDSSNQDQSFLRNRIRHQLIPLLKGYNSSIVTQLASTALLLQEDAALLEQQLRRGFDPLSCSGPGWCGLELEPLRRHPPPVRNRFYRLALSALIGSTPPLELRHHQLLDRLVMDGRTGALLQLPADLQASLTARHLLLCRTALSDSLQFEPLELAGEGEYQLSNGLFFSVRKGEPPESWFGLHPTVTYLDQDAAPFPWLLRPVEKGDRMELLGAAGGRLLHDILIDLKIPRHLRRAIPLLCQGGRALWLPGLRRSRHAVIEPDSRSALSLTIRNLDRLPLFPAI